MRVEPLVKCRALRLELPNARGFAMGQAISGADELHRRRGSLFCPASERCCAGATAVSDCGRARRRLAGRGGFMATADATGRTKREKIIKANPLLERFTVADLRNWADRKMRIPGS
jgi:hypothetical protein